MKPRVLLFSSLLLLAAGGAVWWKIQDAHEEKKLSSLLERESADIAYRKSRGPVDAVLKQHPEAGSPKARAGLAALLPSHPDSDYLRYQLGRVSLQSPGPDAPAALAALEPCWLKIQGGLSLQPVRIGARVALEEGYARLLSGADDTAGEAFDAALRLASDDDRKRIEREIAERRATALFFRRSSVGFSQALAQLQSLRNQQPANPVVWEMLARISLEDPADHGSLAREALPHLRDKGVRGEIEKRLAVLPTP